MSVKSEVYTNVITPLPAVDKVLRACYAVWVFALVLALLPYTENPVEPVKMFVSAVLAVVVALTLAIKCVFSGRRCPATTTGGILLFWLGWQLLSALLSGHVANSLHALQAPITWTVLALGAAQVFREPRTAWRFLTVLVVALGLSSLYGFFQKFGLDPFPWAIKTTEEYRAIPATFGNPNFAGHALIPGLFIAAALVARRGARWLALPMALMAVHLYLTGMRAAFVSVGVGSLFLFFWWISGRLTAKPLTRLVAVTVFFVVLEVCSSIFAVLELPKHLTYNPVNRDTSLALRCNSAVNAMHMMAEAPILGVGPGNYEIDTPTYWTPMEQRWYALSALKNDHVHCEPLEAGAELGVVGILLHFLLLAWLFLRGIQLAGKGDYADTRRLGRMLAACATVYAVDGLFGFNLHVPVSSAIFFVLLGIAEGVWRGRPGAEAYVARRAGKLVWSGALLGALAALFMAVLGVYSGVMLSVTGGLFDGSTRRQLNAKELSVAQDLLLRSARWAPWDPRFHDRLGLLELDAAQYGPAAAAFSGALERHPNNPGYWALKSRAVLGLAAGRARNRDMGGARFLLRQAESDVQRALYLCPALAMALDVRWRAAALHGDLDREAGLDASVHDAQCIEYAQAALQAGIGDTAPVWRILARQALRMDLSAKAADDLVQALEKGPLNTEAWELVDMVCDRGDGLLLLDALFKTRASLVRYPKPLPEAVCRASSVLVRLLGSDQPGAVLGRSVASDTVKRFPGELGAWALVAQWAPTREVLACLREEAAGLTASGVSATLWPPLVQALLAEPVQTQTLADAAELLARVVDAWPEDQRQGPVKRMVLWTAPLLQEAAVSVTPADQARLLIAAGGIHLVAEQWTEADHVFAGLLAGELSAEMKAPALAARSEALAHLDRKEEALSLAIDAAGLAPENGLVLLMKARRLAESGQLDAARKTYLEAMAKADRRLPVYARVSREYGALTRTIAANGSHTP